MNNVILDNPGGFPFEQDTLKFMQEAHADLLNKLGGIAGDKAILYGCDMIGNTVMDGLVFLNGELFFFKGGAIQPTVIIVEEVTQMPYADGVNRDTYKKRYVKFGSGANQYNWADFRRAYLQSAVMLDEIRMYAGNLSDLPLGWYLCDGQNGTVDLRGRFVVGYNANDTDYDQVGKTGGEKAHALTEDEMPAHTHAGGTDYGGIHNHYGHVIQASGDWKGGGNDSSPNSTSRPGYTNDAGGHSHQLNIQQTGGGQSHENRPPYYTLAYIQFKGY